MINLEATRKNVDEAVKSYPNSGKTLQAHLELMGEGPAFRNNVWDVIISLAGIALAESMQRISEAEEKE